MRFVVTGEWSRNRLLQTIVVLYVIYVAGLWTTNALLYFGKMSLDPASVVEYYLGAEERFLAPRSYQGLLEISHFHLFAMGMLLLVLTHLMLFVPLAGPHQAAADRVAVRVGAARRGLGLARALRSPGLRVAQGRRLPRLADEPRGLDPALAVVRVPGIFAELSQRRTARSLSAALALAALGCAERRASARHAPRRRPLMGTVLQLTLVADDAAHARAAADACFALGAELEAVLTTYDAGERDESHERERGGQAPSPRRPRWPASSPTRSASRARRAACSIRRSAP